MPVIIIVLVGIVLGMIIAEPLIQLLVLLVGGKSSIDNNIADYIESLALSDEQLIYGIVISISLICLLLPAYNKLKKSIESDSKSEQKGELENDTKSQSNLF